MTLEQQDPAAHYEKVEIDKSALWSTISNHTGLDRTACKTIIISMLFGGDLISDIVHFGLDVDQVVQIRMAFNEFSYRNRAGA